MFLFVDMSPTNNTSTLIAYLNLSDQFMNSILEIQYIFDRIPAKLSPTFIEFAPSIHATIDIIDYDALTISDRQHLHQKLFRGDDGSDGFIIELVGREIKWASGLPTVQKSTVNLRVNSCAFWFFCMHGETTKIPFSCVRETEE